MVTVLVVVNIVDPKTQAEVVVVLLVCKKS